MSSPDSIMHWLELLRTGNQAAAQELWERYFQRLVFLARAKLRGAISGAVDEEALSAFDSFCRGARQDRFPQLQDRNDLWKLLFVITARKATALVRRELRMKRGGGRVWTEAEL